METKLVCSVRGKISAVGGGVINCEFFCKDGTLCNLASGCKYQAQATSAPSVLLHPMGSMGEDVA